MATYLTPELFRQLTPGAAAVTDEVAFLFLDATEAAVKKFLGYDPAAASVTEYYTTHGDQYLTLRRRPVTAVAAVYEDASGYFGDPTGAFDSTATLLTAGTGYAVETGADGLPTGRLYRVGRRWPVAWTREPRRLANSLAGNAGCVKVTYTAGFAPGAPADVIAACYGEASARYLRRAGIGAQTSVSMDGYAKTYGPVSGSDPLASGTPTGPFVTADLKSALLSYRVPAIA